MLKRDRKVTFRLSAEEQQFLRKNVKRTGLSQEAYIREVLAGSVPRETPPLEYHALMKELRAIGNRMNQIAARANTTGFFLAKEYEENAKGLRQAVLQIQAAVTLPEKKTWL